MQMPIKGCLRIFLICVKLCLTNSKAFVIIIELAGSVLV